MLISGGYLIKIQRRGGISFYPGGHTDNETYFSCKSVNYKISALNNFHCNDFHYLKLAPLLRDEYKAFKLVHCKFFA